MRSISVHAGNNAFSVSDETLYNTDNTEIVYYPAALNGSYVVVNSVRSIGDYAFAGSSLSNIDTNAIAEMGSYTFVDADIIQITLSENLTVIPKGSFKQTKLASIHIPDNVQIIEDEAFISCRYLKELSFGDNSELLEIQGSELYGAFAYCRLLKNFAFPDTLQSIGERAFYQCSSITELIMPVNVSMVGERAFQYCIMLQKVAFTEN